MEIVKKIVDSKKADLVEELAELDFEKAKRVAEEIEDREAKIQALISLYNVSKDGDFLDRAISLASSDEDFLRIVEYSDYCDDLIKVVSLISKPYIKNVAYATLLEKTGDLSFSTKIRDVRILSASLKRLSSKLRYPESLTVAMMIPDAYYKSLALIELSKRESVDLSQEISKIAENIKSKYLRERVISLLKSLL